MATTEISVDVLRSTRYDPVCVKTGRPHERWIKASFYYVPPWVYLFVLVGLLPLIVIMLVVRKQATVYLPAVNQVQRNRALVTTSILVALFAGVIVLIGGAVDSSWPLSIIGVALIVSSIVLGFVGTERAWVRGALSSDQTTVKLRGAHPDFVARTTQLAHPPPMPPPAGPSTVTDLAGKPGLQNLSYVREGRHVGAAPVSPAPTPPRTVPLEPSYVSGQGAGSVVPPELGSWNWGGFLLSWMWSIGNYVWVGLLALLPIPLLFIAMSIVLGVKGNEWAWQKKQWRDVEHFKRVQKRWTIAGVIFWVLLLGGIVWAVIAAAPWESANVIDGEFDPRSADSTEVIEDEDGEFTLTVPTSWFPDGSMNRRADLGVGSPFEEMYAIVFVERSDRFPKRVTLGRYSAISRGPILGGLTNASEEKVGTRTIDGYDAIEYELRGTIDGLDVVYLHTVLETDTHFVQILAWTLEPRFDRNSETLRAVINSFDAK